MPTCVSVCAQSLSRVLLFATPETVAHQAPLSVESSKQEYWSRFRFHPSWDIPVPGIKHMSLLSHELAGGFFTTVPSVKTNSCLINSINILAIKNLCYLKTHSGK